MLEPHGLDRLGNAQRLILVEADRHPGGHSAVATGACANMSQDHEGGGTLTPALSNVGAVRFFADRMQALRSHQPLEMPVLAVSGRPHLEPGRLSAVGPGVLGDALLEQRLELLALLAKGGVLRR